MIRAFLMLLVLCSPVFGQAQVSVTKAKSLVGVTNARIVGDRMLIGFDSVPAVSNVAVVKVVTDYKWIEFESWKSFDEESTWEPLSDAEGNNEFVVMGSGNHRVTVRVSDPVKGPGKKTTLPITIDPDAPAPKPDPKPDPDNPTPPIPGPVPPDGFDNIGQRVNGWARGLAKKTEVAAIYRDAAKELQTIPSATVNSVADGIVSKRTQVLGDDVTKYANLVQQLNADMKSRWPMSKGVLATYFIAIAVGLEGK